MISILPIEGLPLIKVNENIINFLGEKISKLQNEDILVIAHTIISRIENCEVKLDEVKPSDLAIKISEKTEKDPRVIEVVLQQSKSIVRMSENILICESYHGFICANAGVDRSNATPGYVLTLPINPDNSARIIQKQIFEKTGKKVGIIISDTYGRVFRKGTTNFAIGVAGINPINSYKGDKDLFGYELQTSEVAVVDEIASAAGLVMGQSNEGIPIVIVRGMSETNIKVKITLDTEYKSEILLRKRNESLFW